MNVWVMADNPDYPSSTSVVAVASTAEGAKLAATHLMTGKESTIEWEQQKTPDIWDGTVTNAWPGGVSKIHVRVSKETVDEFSYDMTP